MKIDIKKLIIISLLSVFSTEVFASNIDVSTLSLSWGIPFAGILLSIALFPLLLPTIWHHHYGKIVIFWTMLFIIPFLFTFGFDAALHTMTHALLEEYVPFILLLLALFTVSGGILIQGHLQGSPKLNVTLLAIGTILASMTGTTGAAMLMIRPILRANQHRKQQIHVIIFFIFLVANIGGGLTPLGDPPLFIGFLKGVDFMWTVKHMLLPVLLTSCSLLLLFYFIDNYYYQKNGEQIEHHPTMNKQIKIYGKPNFILLVMIVAMVLMSGIWQSTTNLTVFGSKLALQNIVRDVMLVIITLIALLITPKQIRNANQFDWQPILEVAKLFVGIFITIVPVIAILRAGSSGSLSSVLTLVTDNHGQPINAMYFWLTGLLSGFLDNAPTYLVFFNLASGDAVTLMEPLEKTLLAISMGAVFMGALTYIGNAPNLMVKSIAMQSNIKMPSFFGYMKWSIGILIPVFIIDTLVFFIL